MEKLLLSCETSAQVDEILERSFSIMLHGSNIKDLHLDIAQKELQCIVTAAMSPDDSPYLSDTLALMVQNAKLQGLLGELLHSARRQLWRDIATRSESFPSPPQLLDVAWLVDMPVAADTNQKRDPTAHVDLTIQNMPNRVDVFPPLRHIAFKLDRDALDSIVHELHNVRDQIQRLHNTTESAHA
ncbi:hypothetical protein Ae201684_008419 [Aphanomyces euteiches]|uniref:COMM domain-containing protein n=1 Tax=Aphanomyces euteiches TaxID=100861 RepID=A0A6G0X4W0_9STRA|nr:hypothetical protein Ae201684_008419 [Aphanomyces euteiches]